MQSCIRGTSFDLATSIKQRTILVALSKVSKTTACIQTAKYLSSMEWCRFALFVIWSCISKLFSQSFPRSGGIFDEYVFLG